jgi:hypothetical protein
MKTVAEVDKVPVGSGGDHDDVVVARAQTSKSLVAAADAIAPNPVSCGAIEKRVNPGLAGDRQDVQLRIVSHGNSRRGRRLVVLVVTAKDESHGVCPVVEDGRSEARERDARSLSRPHAVRKAAHRGSP